MITKLTNAKRYRICLAKAYWEKGNGLLNYLKWIIGYFGVASGKVVWTLLFAFIYFIACYFVGRYWYLKHWVEAELEVSNMHNKFVKEMRKTLKK